MLVAGTAAGSLANGFRLPNQDPEAIARGNAFVATADNPAAIYYNPAGITQIEGQQLRAGIYLISTGAEHHAGGQTSKADSNFQPVPQLYYVISPKDQPFSFGLGVYTPYGLSIDWGDDTPFATRGTEGQLMYLTVNPVIAWQIHEQLSLAIGPNISFSEAEFQQSYFLRGVDRFKFKGDDWGASFNAGLLWKPHEQWAFGVNYRYLTTMDYEGDVGTSPSGPPAPIPYFPKMEDSASIRFPQSVAFGLSYRPTENWNLEVGADWTDWDNLNAISFRRLGMDVVLDYESSWMYNFGVTRKLPCNFFGSAGYIYSENSSPSEGFHPLIPDSILHLFSIGFGQKLTRWDWAISYTYAHNPGREVRGSALAPNGAGTGFARVADGEYEIGNHAINIAATWKF